MRRILLVAVVAAAVALALVAVAWADPKDPPHPPQHLGASQACQVDLYWFVAPERQVNIMQRPKGTPGARWEWVLSVTGDFPATSLPFYSDHDYLAEVPGPTSTIWPTPEPDTPTPTTSPTQTPWIVTATPTDTPTPTRPVAILSIPLALIPRRR